MGEAVSGVTIDADLKEVWDAYFDQARWPSWVDGFSATLDNDGYPETGGTLRWRSTPAGRGEVTEKVLEHDPRRLHRVEFSDPESAGELEARFEIEGSGVLVAQRMTYKVLHPGLLGPLTDILFVRRQVTASLERSLDAFKHECEGGL